MPSRPARRVFVYALCKRRGSRLVDVPDRRICYRNRLGFHAEIRLQEKSLPVAAIKQLKITI